MTDENRASNTCIDCGRPTTHRMMKMSGSCAICADLEDCERFRAASRPSEAQCDSDERICRRKSCGHDIRSHKTVGCEECGPVNRCYVFIAASREQRPNEALPGDPEHNGNCCATFLATGEHYEHCRQRTAQRTQEAQSISCPSCGPCCTPAAGGGVGTPYLVQDATCGNCGATRTVRVSDKALPAVEMIRELVDVLRFTNPTEHPVMHAAWVKGTKFLEETCPKNESRGDASQAAMSGSTSTAGPSLGSGAQTAAHSSPPADPRVDYPRYAQTWQVRRAAPVWQVRRDRSNRYLGAYEWVRNEKQAVHFVTREAAEEAAEIARRENSGVEVIEAAPRSDSVTTPKPGGTL